MGWIGIALVWTVLICAGVIAVGGSDLTDDDL